jgi:hypothetical protein
MSETPRERAEQSISAGFTRVMNATTSRWGMFTDPSIIGLCTAPVAVALLAAVRLEAAPALITGLEVLVALPVTVAVGLALALRSARAGVTAWLAGVPFPIENMNAVLNGLGDALEVTFRDQPPEVKALNVALDQVSSDCFVSKSFEDGEPVVTGAPAPPSAALEIRIGVVDSTRNPSVSNHRRFLRVQALVTTVLIPLAERHPIVEVRVK